MLVGGNALTASPKSQRATSNSSAAAPAPASAGIQGVFPALAGNPWSAAVRSELLDRLKAAGKLGYQLAREAGASDPEVRPSAPVPAMPAAARNATPVGPFAVVALASESQKVILRQALERTDEFNLYCTQDAGEAAALLSTYDPDLFVIDGGYSSF